MVENERNLWHFSYLDNAIFKPSKINVSIRRNTRNVAIKPVKDVTSTDHVNELPSQALLCHFWRIPELTWRRTPEWASTFGHGFLALPCSKRISGTSL